MLPSEKYKIIAKNIAKTANYCGANVLNPKYKPNFVTYFVILSIIIYFIFTIYTINIKIFENWKILFEIMCMCGSVLQVKFYKIL